ncbi:GH92 family glycosyl hydrolase [Caldithrix abyssi]
MKRLSFLLVIFTIFWVYQVKAQQSPVVKNYIQFVNPFIGTGSVDSMSLSGSNFPGAVYPWGLVQLSPDTRDNPEDPCSGYDYADSIIVGFSHTHLSGTGVADLFDFLFMPYQGPLSWQANPQKNDPGYRSTFRHENEDAQPGYYRVLLDRSQINLELTATEHCGMHRYTFANADSFRLMIDLDHSLDKKRPYWVCRLIGAEVRIVDNKTIEGYRIITGWAPLRKVYFRAEFSRPFACADIKAGRQIFHNAAVVNHPRLKLNLTFEGTKNKPLLIKVGLSSVNYEGARLNLKKEIPHFDFNRVVKGTQQAWNNVLACVDVQSTPEQKRIFYTALYHLFIHPNNIADVNGHYLNTNFDLRTAPDGVHYSTFSLWDTYRAAHPLYTILRPDMDAKFINSMLRQYRDFGYLPIWQLWGSETYCMIGNHAIPVIADAFHKKIPGIDYDFAYQAVKASSTIPHQNSPFHLLDRFHYFPENLQTQSVSLTLEIAYDDWCAAQMAKALGHEQDARYLLQRSQYYKNLFDPEIGFFRARDDQGHWMEPFSPLKYGGNGGYPFTEGNAWQYLWYVPHDVYSFIELMGGREKFIRKLDTFFTLEAKPADVNGNASGFIGQYAHGNEPSHHIAYLYDFVGQPWKTQYYTAKIMREQYTDQPSGYSGNEDCGQMSAWYIFSAMGFYPVNPANGIYCFGSPQLKRTILHLPDKKIFEIIAHNAGNGNDYIQNILLNGKPYHKLYLRHQDIVNGGRLEFFMGNQPNKALAKYETPPTD